mmetsp:Transcript_23948/g.36689  ORF Transcript_23948/g.36689 Transcript_23948/m.36689 type:complete len:115 (+) Transcript_23948:459-803(+)
MVSTNVSRITKLTLQKKLAQRNEEIDEDEYGDDPQTMLAILSQQLESEQQILFDVILSKVEHQLRNENMMAGTQAQQHINHQLEDAHKRYTETPFFEVVDGLSSGDDELMIKDS